MSVIIQKYIAVTGFLLLSCNSGSKVLYGTNTERSFKTMEAYAGFIKDKYHFDLSNFYYSEKESYDSLVYYVARNNVDYLMGIFESDSIEYMKSTFLSDNESCFGRIANEIDNINETNKTINRFFQHNQFKGLTTERNLDIQGTQKKIILVVSYKQGRIHKNEFLRIERLIKKRTDFRLVILSLDPVFDLK